MSKRLFFILFLIVGTAQHISALEEITRVHPTQAISIEDLDALEDIADQTHTFDTIHVKPPSPLMITIRKIGMPMLIFFLNARRKLANAWEWVLQQTAGKNACVAISGINNE